jgi:hypothetical protein
MKMGELQLLGEKHKTDKARYGILNVYEKYFANMKHSPIKLLELGALWGASLRMWKEYFPLGTIYGLDIEPIKKQNEEDRIIIEIGSQDDASVLNKLIEHAGYFDIVIDDGCHLVPFIIRSFRHLFPVLRSGGIYSIEDLGLSYNLEAGKDTFAIVPMAYELAKQQKDSLVNNRAELDDFFLKLIKDVDHGTGMVESVQFWSQTCFIIKK